MKIETFNGLDLDELGRIADVDARSLVSYFGPRRDSMRPRIRARIERAIATLRERPRASKSEGPRA